ncbi:MAG: hypothetical protein ACXU97_12905, partial [Thermodesulfobacteriota bacterium]
PMSYIKWLAEPKPGNAHLRGGRQGLILSSALNPDFQIGVWALSNLSTEILRDGIKKASLLSKEKRPGYFSAMKWICRTFR